MASDVTVILIIDVDNVTKTDIIIFPASSTLPATTANRETWLIVHVRPTIVAIPIAPTVIPRRNDVQNCIEKPHCFPSYL